MSRLNVKKDERGNNSECIAQFAMRAANLFLRLINDIP